MTKQQPDPQPEPAEQPQVVQPELPFEEGDRPVREPQFDDDGDGNTYGPEYEREKLTPDPESVSTEPA